MTITTKAQLSALGSIRRSEVVVNTHLESFSSGRLFVWTEDGSEAQVRPDGRVLWSNSAEREDRCQTCTEHYHGYCVYCSEATTVVGFRPFDGLYGKCINRPSCDARVRLEARRSAA